MKNFGGVKPHLNCLKSISYDNNTNFCENNYII